MLENFINSIRNIFAVPDLRRRVLFTLAMLAIYRLGSHVRTPGIDPARSLCCGRPGRCKTVWPTSGPLFRRQFQSGLDLCAGNNAIYNRVHHLAVDDGGQSETQGSAGGGRTWPPQDHPVYPLSNGGALFGSIVRHCLLAAEPEHSDAAQLVPNPGPGFIALSMLTLATGTTFIMWLGEQITERGVGNGISLTYLRRHRPPVAMGRSGGLRRLTSGGTGTALGVIALFVMMVFVIAAIVFVERGFRKMPIDHARRMVGRQSIPQQQTHMPLKVNMAWRHSGDLRFIDSRFSADDTEFCRTPIRHRLRVRAGS